MTHSGRLTQKIKKGELVENAAVWKANMPGHKTNKSRHGKNNTYWHLISHLGGRALALFLFCFLSLFIIIVYHYYDYHGRVENLTQFCGPSPFRSLGFQNCMKMNFEFLLCLCEVFTFTYNVSPNKTTPSPVYFLSWTNGGNFSVKHTQNTLNGDELELSRYQTMSPLEHTSSGIQAYHVLCSREESKCYVLKTK